MKQAILITAYKNIDQIIQIIDYFDSDFEFYIHIDKKSKLDLTPLTGITDKKVSVYNEYSINWGGLNHLKAILLLANEALKNDENTFFHLITGEDYPCKSLSSFHNSLDKSKDYIDFAEMPRKDWPENGGMDRIAYYNFYDLFNAKKMGRLINLIIRIQKILGLKRAYSPHFPKLYGGSTYWSLSRKTLQYVMDYTAGNKHLFDRMKFTFCAEEMYFQTILLDSPFAHNLINDNLRYIDWISGRGGKPAFLDASDFSNMMASNGLFARKFGTNEKSVELKNLLILHLKSDK
ncbi:MAG: beta-1,6-N-acetylglucosaminyltransferase [Candidatus Symbiothrix sp.]|jgi:hypothetical protein|nr:beta-1,6-N-acetylglucosaminyltransferase [Candidatus Symbiothrix sp.]